MALPLTAIVTALGEELAPLLHRAAPLRWVRTGCGRAALGRLRGQPVVMAATGVGRRRAEAGVLATLAVCPAARLVGAGVAGGLSPGLAPGELILAREVVAAAEAVPTAVPVAPSSAWSPTGRSGPRLREGTVVTVERLLTTRDAKADVLARVAPVAPAVVDMESAGWARAASSLGLSYAIVRAVLDPAEEDLPAFLAACALPDGGVARTKVVAHALVHPADLRVLLALRRRVRDCAEALARAVETLVEIES